MSPFRRIRRFLDPAEFILRVEAGALRVERGGVPPRRLAALRDVVHDSDVDSGVVRGLRDGTRIRLECSDEIPESVRQRLRNAWVSAG